MPFAKGNQLAAAPKPWTRALERHAKQNPDKMAKLAALTFDAALSGDMQAVREIGDRLDGKPKASTEVTGANGSALFPVTAINVVGVEPAAIVAGELERIADAEPAAD